MKFAPAIVGFTVIIVASCTRAPVDDHGAQCSAVANLTFCAPQVPLTEAEIDAGIEAIDAGCQEKSSEAAARGAACEVAFQEGLECLAELECEEFMSWTAGDPESPCHAHRARVEHACGDLPLEPQLGIPG